MSDDKLSAFAYHAIMVGGQAHIIVTIDTKNPIEIGDFVSAFTSVANQYDKFIRDRHPYLSPEARIFVKEVERGSIVADLIPFLPYALFGLHSIIPQIEQINIVTEFVDLYGQKLKAYFSTNGKDDTSSSSDLKDFMGSIAAIANDTDGKSSVEAVYFEDGRKQVTAAVRFDTKTAVAARKAIEQHRLQLERRKTADFDRVLMVFTQSNVKDSGIGKRTGEWVQIEAISDKELPLIYASDLAERRIKHEIREADDNVFKKGFVVDVNVETKGGRPVAYRVTNLHQVIDLPEE